MSTLEVLLLLVAAMFVGAVLAFAFMFRHLLRSETWLELKSNTMEVVLRDMYGHDVESLNKTLAAQRR